MIRVHQGGLIWPLERLSCKDPKPNFHLVGQESGHGPTAPAWRNARCLTRWSRGWLSSPMVVYPSPPPHEGVVD